MFSNPGDNPNLKILPLSIAEIERYCRTESKLSNLQTNVISKGIVDDRCLLQLSVERTWFSSIRESVCYIMNDNLFSRGKKQLCLTLTSASSIRIYFPLRRLLHSKGRQPHAVLILKRCQSQLLNVICLHPACCWIPFSTVRYKNSG